MNTCLNCGVETTNLKYCSRSCAATINNKKSPKRKKTKTCKTCDSKIISLHTYCTFCNPFKNPKDITLEEAIYKKHHKSSAYALVRSRARKIAKDNNMNCCEVCGYSKHVEIAHIKSISSFDSNTLISVINDLSNLKALCPNCHWEFDNKK